LRGHVLDAPGREVVEDVDGVALFDERVGDVRADESGASGNEDLHGGDDESVREEIEDEDERG
jgi:hypothetical protein